MKKLSIVMLDDWENYFSSQIVSAEIDDLADITVYQQLLYGQALFQAIANAEIIILLRERTAVNTEFIAHSPKLKHIICTGAQVRNLDSVAVKKAGITLAFAAGGDSKSSTCELTWTLMLAAYKQLDKLRINQTQRQWRQATSKGNVFLPSSLKDKQLGLLGLGSIGQKVAAVAQAFGMKVVCWSPNMTPERAAGHGVEALSLNALLSTSDIISIHLVLGETTRHTINAQNLSLVKNNSLLVNTSRAEIIDSEALLRALQNGDLAMYATDVFEQEPLSSEYPFYSLDTVLMTSHFGFVATEVYQLFATNIVKEIKAYLMRS